eukprot:gene24630-29759_t
MEHQEAKEVEDTQDKLLKPAGESLEGSIPSPLNQDPSTPPVDADEMLLSERLVVAEKLAEESHVITGSASIDSSVSAKRHSHQSTQLSVKKIQIIYSFVTRSVYKDVDVERVAGILDRLGCAPVSLNMKRKIVAQGSRSLSGYGFAVFRSLQDALRAVGGLSKLVDDGITYDAQLATCTRKLYSKALQALAAEDQSSDVHDVHNDGERVSPTTSASPKPASSTSGSRTPRDDAATPPQAQPALQGAFPASIHHQSPAVSALPLVPPYPHYFVAHPPASVVSPCYPAPFPVHQPAMLPQAPLAPAEWARHAFQEFGVPIPMEAAIQQQHQLSMLYAEQVQQHQLIGHPHQQRQYHVPQVPQDGTYGAQHPFVVQYSAPAGGLPQSSHNPHHAMGLLYQPHRQPQHFNVANHPVFYPAHPYAAPVAHVPQLMHPTPLPHNGMPTTCPQRPISMAALTQQHNRRAHHPPRSHHGTVHQPHPPSDQFQSNQS